MESMMTIATYKNSTWEVVIQTDCETPNITFP